MIVIVDYGLGNLGSIKNMLNKIGVDSLITSDKEIINDAQKLILPGVGAFHTGMRNLAELNLIDVLNKKVLVEKTPVLGICLGMQLFTNHSEEGDSSGLGWIDAETVKFNPGESREKISIPHMGWEFVDQTKNSNLFSEMYDKPKFYFVHSYYVKCRNKEDISLTANYIHSFVAAFEKDNIIGVQFHPEKSHKYGIKLYKNFVENY